MIRRMLRRIDVVIADRVLPWRGDVDPYPVGSRVVAGGKVYEIEYRAYDFDRGRIWYLLTDEDGDYERAVHHYVDASTTVITPDNRDSRTSAGDQG